LATNEQPCTICLQVSFVYSQSVETLFDHFASTKGQFNWLMKLFMESCALNAANIIHVESHITSNTTVKA